MKKENLLGLAFFEILCLYSSRTKTIQSRRRLFSSASPPATLSYLSSYLRSHRSLLAAYSLARPDAKSRMPFPTTLYRNLIVSKPGSASRRVVSSIAAFHALAIVDSHRVRSGSESAVYEAGCDSRFQRRA